MISAPAITLSSKQLPSLLAWQRRNPMPDSVSATTSLLTDAAEAPASLSHRFIAFGVGLIFERSTIVFTGSCSTKVLSSVVSAVTSTCSSSDSSSEQDLSAFSSSSSLTMSGSAFIGIGCSFASTFSSFCISDIPSKLAVGVTSCSLAEGNPSELAF